MAVNPSVAVLQAQLFLKVLQNFCEPSNATGSFQVLL